MFIGVMANLRRQVQLLEENYLFEQTIIRGSLVTEQQTPPSNDIDSIMRSMMNLSSNPANDPPVNPPSERSNGVGVHNVADLTVEPTSFAHPTTPLFRMPATMETGETPGVLGRRSTRLKIKPRRP